MKPVYPVLSKRPDPSLIKEIELGINQEEYRTLPALKGSNPWGTVTSRWELTWAERIFVLLTGNIWLQMFTFHGRPQPVKLSATEPSEEDCQ